MKFYIACLLVLCTACSAKHDPDADPFHSPSQSAKPDLGISIIGGTPVDPGTFKNVFKIVTNSAACTATLIGPKVFVTAAHCGKTDQVSQFSIDGVAHTATLERAPLYPGQDHDIALGLINEEIAGVQPVSVGGKLEVGTDVMIMGYGCTQPGGGGGNDGILRQGVTKVISFSNYDAVMKSDVALCFGDSGGPGMVQAAAIGEKVPLRPVWKIAAVNSKGNIKDTSYGAQLLHAESTKFLQAFVEKHKVEICGVNKDCDTPPLPEFTLENKFVKVHVVVKDDEAMSQEYLKTNFENLMRFLDPAQTGFEFFTP